MRVVLDSNVLIAALVTRGGCAELFEHVLANHTFGVDENLLGEVERVLRDKIRIPEEPLHGFIQLLRDHGKLTDPEALQLPVSRDPDDDRILALCLAFEAGALVTGDADLLVLDPWNDLRILRPRDFWPFERTSGGPTER